MNFTASIFWWRFVMSHRVQNKQWTLLDSNFQHVGFQRAIKFIFVEKSKNKKTEGFFRWSINGKYIHYHQIVCFIFWTALESYSWWCDINFYQSKCRFYLEMCFFLKFIKFVKKKRVQSYVSFWLFYWFT